MRKSQYFIPREFACKCGCGMKEISEELLDVLEGIREHYEEPVHIQSGCRCPKHNAAIGGVQGSQHTRGTAADIHVSNISPEDLYEFIDNSYPKKYGLGIYDWGVHIDVRDQHARWDKRGVE